MNSVTTHSMTITVLWIWSQLHCNYNVSIFKLTFDFNFEPSFKLRWYRARDLSGTQCPVIKGGFEP